MSDKRWKAHERAVACALGGQRLPNNGRGSPDVLTAVFALEVKTRKALPAWLWDALSQAQANCPKGKRPALVLVESRQGVKARRLVVLDWEIFMEVANRQVL